MSDQGLGWVRPRLRVEAPRTVQSPTRWAVNKELRDAVCDFAGDYRRASPRAAKIYGDAVARSKDHPHALRILARARLAVIWRCWRNLTAYDPAQHGALKTLLDTANAA